MEEFRAVSSAYEAEDERALDAWTGDARGPARVSMVALVLGTMVSSFVLITVYRRMRKELKSRRGSKGRLMRVNRLYDLLTRVSQATVRSRDRNRLYEEVCRIAVENGGFVMAWVGAVAESGANATGGSIGQRPLTSART